MTTQSTATTTEKQDGRTRDNPAHAVLKHLAGAHAEIVKTAIREVTIARLESNGAVAGLAVLRSELFGNGGGAAGSAHSSGGEARATAPSSRKPKQMTLDEAAQQSPKDDDDEVEEEEVEDDEEDEDEEGGDETPAPDAPLRRSIMRAGKGPGPRKGKRG